MGSIYRYFQGEVRQLVSGMTIPNSICFAPGGRTAYFTDTAVGQIMKQALDPLGWPVGAASVFLDLGAQGIHPDGSVVDANGNLWNAQWGAGRVRCYDANGAVVKTVAVPGRHSSCPAFGGGEFETLFVTTAQEGIANPDASQGPVYFAKPDAKGQPEHRVQVPV
jgi:sugar lactone lactonase YvrE